MTVWVATAPTLGNAVAGRLVVADTVVLILNGDGDGGAAAAAGVATGGIFDEDIDEGAHIIAAVSK